MDVPHFTIDEILDFILHPFEQQEAVRHSVRCLEAAAVIAEENGAKGNAQEFTWAATYLDAGDVACICGGKRL